MNLLPEVEAVDKHSYYVQKFKMGKACVKSLNPRDERGTDTGLVASGSPASRSFWEREKREGKREAICKAINPGDLVYFFP